MSNPRTTDLLIAGGGLSGGLIALALAQRRPEIRITLVEDGSIGGNHVWSFFDGDIDPAMRWLVDPLICHMWMGNEVRFPAHTRILPDTYNAIESERLDVQVRSTLPAGSIVQGRVAQLEVDGAILEDGSKITALGVIDARGSRDLQALELGWQKFVGQLLRLEAPHGLERPVIMDATVDQHDGYRFVYLLPFGIDRIFVEDTYYSDTPEFDRTQLSRNIADYAAAKGWRIAAVEREEQSALPIAMGGDFARLWPPRDRIPRVGMAAGLFQPMTGYSLPDAVRSAALIMGLGDLSTPSLHAALRRNACKTWESRRFYRLLARLLFQAADPPDRYRVLERFYRLNEGMIRRFYAGQSTRRDKARVLMGRPPVPLRRAIAALRSNR